MKTNEQTSTALFLMPNDQPYPPHMQAILTKCQAHDRRQIKLTAKSSNLKSTITDVTPKGYGPND